MNKTFTKILSGFAVAAALCAPAYAQELDVKFGEGVNLPSGLKWQRASITSKHKNGVNTGNIDAKKQEYLYNLWAKEITEKNKREEAVCKNDPRCSFPENLLLAEFSLDGITHRFSSASMVYNGCDSGFIHAVRECLWHYEGVDEKTGNVAHTKSFRMCANVGSINVHRRHDILEFAIDDKNKVVYFTVNAESSSGYDLKHFCSAAISLNP